MGEIINAEFGKARRDRESIEALMDFVRKEIAEHKPELADRADGIGKFLFNEMRAFESIRTQIAVSRPVDANGKFSEELFQQSLVDINAQVRDIVERIHGRIGRAIVRASHGTLLRVIAPADQLLDPPSGAE